MKFIVAFLWIVLGWNVAAFAQLDKAAFPFSIYNPNVTSFSLGNASTSLDGEYGDGNINPAGLGIRNTLQLSVSPKFFANNWFYHSLSGVYGFSKSSINFSVRMMRAGEKLETSWRYPETMPKHSNHEVYVKAGYSLNISEKLNVGAALNYYYSSESLGVETKGISLQNSPSSHSAGIDIGIQYKPEEVKNNFIKIRPAFGLSLTDFGKPAKYYGYENTFSLPTTLRAGASITGISAKKLWGQNLIEVRLMQDLSKFMIRQKITTEEEDISRKAMNPFKALLNSWDKLTYYSNERSRTAHLEEQLWWHSGLELKLLNTLIFRGGYEKTGEIESHLSYWTLGVGLDLYYIAIEYARANYIENYNPYGSYIQRYHVQLTGRIPLDGQRPETILHHLFN